MFPLQMLLYLCFYPFFCSIGFLYFGARKQSLVPNRIQCLVEMSYEFVANMVKENAGKGSQAYFPFVFTLFMFIYSVTY